MSVDFSALNKDELLKLSQKVAGELTRRERVSEIRAKLVEIVINEFHTTPDEIGLYFIDHSVEEAKKEDKALRVDPSARKPKFKRQLPSNKSYYLDKQGKLQLCKTINSVKHAQSLGFRVMTFDELTKSQTKLAEALVNEVNLSNALVYNKRAETWNLSAESEQRVPVIALKEFEKA